MPNRYPERKRIVRDDEDGPVTSHSPMIKREVSSNGVHNNPQQQVQQQQALRGATPKPGVMGVRSYPQQKPFYAAESPETLLAKYANETPSLILHIHHTHFRFGNQESVIPKNSPLMKAFLECVAQKVIPPAAVEVFGDMAVHFYEGCIILRILDHRNLASEAQSGQKSTTNKTATPGTNGTETKDKNSAKLANNETPSASNPTNAPNEANEPKVYTTILRPSPLSMWHDLLYATDGSHGLFPDQLAINIEAELLKFTVRNVDLRVPENSLLAASKYKTTLKPAPKFAPGSLDKAEAQKALFTHRPEVVRKRRGLHEDSLHHGSEYEQLMLIMDEKPVQNSGQFMRLSFIEGWRKKQKVRMMQQKNQPQQSQQGQQGQQHGQQQGQNISNVNGINTNANTPGLQQSIHQSQQIPFSQSPSQRQGSPLTQQSPQNTQFNRQQFSGNLVSNSSHNINFANGIGNTGTNSAMNSMGNLNNLGAMNNMGGLNNVGLNNNTSSSFNGANPGSFGNLNNIGNMNLNMGMGIGTIPMTNNNTNSVSNNTNINTTINGKTVNDSMPMSVSSSPQTQNTQPPGSTTPKTRGKGSRPRGKTGLTRGGGSTRGRGKVGSKASGGDNHLNQGGKTVPGSIGSSTSSAGLSSPVFGLGTVGTPQSQWDTSGLMLGGISSSGGSSGVSGKTVPGKTVPGKTVPGKTVPGKTIPGKTVPGKNVPGKTVPGGATKGRPKSKKEKK